MKACKRTFSHQAASTKALNAMACTLCSWFAGTLATRSTPMLATAQQCFSYDPDKVDHIHIGNISTGNRILPSSAIDDNFIEV